LTNNLFLNSKSKTIIEINKSVTEYSNKYLKKSLQVHKTKYIQHNNSMKEDQICKQRNLKNTWMKTKNKQ
jgi:hypothetical protein